RFSPVELQVVNEINRRAASVNSIVELIDFLFFHISPCLPCDRIGVAFIEEKGKRLVAYHTIARCPQVHLNKGFAQDLKGSSLEAVIRDGRPRVINDLQAYHASHPHSGSTALILREGWRASMTCPLVVDGRPIGALFFNSATPGAYNEHHVRLQRAIAERLSQAADKAYRIEQLETVNRAYQEVLGFVAHELKNPVASMITNARLLCDGYLGEITPQQRQKIERIAYNGQYLIGFIETYLDLQKVENAETASTMLEISSLADEVVRPAIDLLHGQIEGRRMKLEIVVPEEPVPTVGNAELLRVVLINLIGNAIKYGRELGHIRVALEVEGGQGEISVWNEGPGFPPEKRADLFQRFVRQNTPDLIRRKGTGLGLYTCWKVVQLHEGRIWADSELGSWARFAFSIPVAMSASAGGGVSSPQPV
ncbi:MAG: GAF domain-containing sensor histidine kinase, partial [Rhodospirillaceae bacterium]